MIGDLERLAEGQFDRLMVMMPPGSAKSTYGKQYVDANPGPSGVINVALPPYSAALNGVTDDTAAFKAAYQAAPAGGAIYVPYGVAVLQQPGSWGVALTKRVKWLIDGTTASDGTPLASAVPTGGITAPLMLPGLVVGNTPKGFSISQSASDPTDLAVNQNCYVVTHNGGTSNVIANHRTDTLIVSSPASFVWGGLDRMIWAGQQVPSGTSMVQHVGRYIQTLRYAANRGANGSYVQQPELWAACLEYKDMTGLPSSSTAASITIEMDWYGNGADDGNSRQIQSLVIGQANTAGAPVEVGTVIGVYLAAGSTGSVKNVFTIGTPFSGAVLDTRMATPQNSAPIIRMGAGQAIAFEGTSTYRMYFDSSVNSLRWNNGVSQNVVGRGLSVGFQSVFTVSGQIPASAAGNICFLTGTSPMTLTLPTAASVAAGVGYTFTNISSVAVTIVPSSGNTMDCGNVILLPNDRYHVISDGTACWREVFRTNAVSPKWLSPPTLPSYAVASLPGGCSAGAVAYAANGRKPTEGAGAGTGVQVYFDGSRWISVSSGSAVVA
ncbi:MAG: hypothetical protein U1E70_13465 [Acetobacteraceae bacterium]